MDNVRPPAIVSAATHISAPHLSTHEDAQAYESLLAALGKDLTLSSHNLDMVDVSKNAQPYLTGREYAYVSRTTPVTVTSTTETAAGVNLLLTAPAFTPDGGDVWGEFYAPHIETGPAVGSDVLVNWGEGSTLFGRIVLVQTDYAGNTFGIAPTVYAKWRFTPTAASHTYFVGAWGSGLTAASLVGAGTNVSGSYAPMWLRFSKA